MAISKDTIKTNKYKKSSITNYIVSGALLLNLHNNSVSKCYKLHFTGEEREAVRSYTAVLYALRI